jgi:hypothetical protein
VRRRRPGSGSTLKIELVRAQRPWTVAPAPLRRAPNRLPGRDLSTARWAFASVSRGARRGAKASLVASPAHARSQSASWISSGLSGSSASRSVKKHGAAARRSRIASCCGSDGVSLLLFGGPISSASSRN